jgi:hypothetical protein
MNIAPSATVISEGIAMLKKCGIDPKIFIENIKLYLF